ncbi:5782_t:CDS:2, partial [Acaulospora colombiana]
MNIYRFKTKLNPRPSVLEVLMRTQKQPSGAYVGECSTTPIADPEASSSASPSENHEQLQNLVMIRKMQEFIDNVLAQEMGFPSKPDVLNIEKACENIPSDMHSTNVEYANEFIENMQNSKMSQKDYLRLMLLLENHQTIFSHDDLRNVITELCKPAAYKEDPVETTTILLELNLRSLLSAIRAYSSVETLTRKFREEILAKLAEFADLHYRNSSNAVNTIRKTNPELASRFFEEVNTDEMNSKVTKLLRNNNIDFLLTVLHDTVRDMDDDDVTSEATCRAATLTINS